jgi:hypothetical protein
MRVAPGLTQLWRTTWRKGWDRLVTYRVAGRSYLLIYRERDGAVIIARMTGG